MEKFRRLTCVQENPIGKGGFGEVFLIREPVLDSLHALKIQIFDNSNDKSKKYAELEALIGKSIKHNHVMRYLNTYNIPQNDGTTLIATTTEYLRNGNLRDFILENQRLSDDVILLYFFQLLQALQYLKENDLVHLDIKLDNIMLKENNYVNPRDCVLKTGLTPALIDFGFINFIGSPLCGFLGTIDYAAVEIILEEVCLPASNKMDIYSLGVVLFNLSHENLLPFDERSKTKLIRKVVIHKYSLRMSSMFGIAFLINNMLLADPEERMDQEKLMWYTLALIRLPKNLEEIRYDDFTSKFRRKASIEGKEKITEEQFKQMYGFNYSSDENKVNKILGKKSQCHNISWWQMRGERVPKPPNYVYGVDIDTIINSNRQGRILKQKNKATMKAESGEPNKIKMGDKLKQN